MGRDFCFHSTGACKLNLSNTFFVLIRRLRRWVLLLQVSVLRADMSRVNMSRRMRERDVRRAIRCTCVHLRASQCDALVLRGVVRGDCGRMSAVRGGVDMRRYAVCVRSESARAAVRGTGMSGVFGGDQQQQLRGERGMRGGRDVRVRARILWRAVRRPVGVDLVIVGSVDGGNRGHSGGSVGSGRSGGVCGSADPPAAHSKAAQQGSSQADKFFQKLKELFLCLSRRNNLASMAQQLFLHLP